MIALEQNSFTRVLQNYGREHQPEAILIFSAHYERTNLHVTYTDEVYETIYDFGGFSEELYRMTYPARGSTQVANQIIKVLENLHIPVNRDPVTGLDHGTWTILKHMYPEADIPVIQLSVNPFLSFEEQYHIGQALSQLKNKNYLLIGSGATVHNLGLLRWDKQSPDQWAIEFDDWLLKQLEQNHKNKLFQTLQLAPYADKAIPRPEHFVPIILAYGAAGEHAITNILHRHYDYGNLSYLIIEFT